MIEVLIFSNKDHYQLQGHSQPGPEVGLHTSMQLLYILQLARNLAKFIIKDRFNLSGFTFCLLSRNN